MNDIDIDLNQNLESAIKERPGVISDLMAFLRRHSKLYILTKGIVSDRSKVYSQHDYQLYKEEHFTEAMRILDGISTELRNQQTDLTVVIIPYEYQLRKTEPDLLMPQRLLAAHLKTQGIDYLDLYESFRSAGGDASRFYLNKDFTHLSPEGHQLVARAVKDKLTP